MLAHGHLSEAVKDGSDVWRWQIQMEQGGPDLGAVFWTSRGQRMFLAIKMEPAGELLMPNSGMWGGAFSDRYKVMLGTLFPASHRKHGQTKHLQATCEWCFYCTQTFWFLVWLGAEIHENYNPVSWALGSMLFIVPRGTIRIPKSRWTQMVWWFVVEAKQWARVFKNRKYIHCTSKPSSPLCTKWDKMDKVLQHFLQMQLIF